MKRINRNLHRILTLLLSAVIAISVGNAAFAQGSSAYEAKYLSDICTEHSLYPDVADSSYNEAIGVLDALGIMETDSNGNFNPDKKVTRGEMAKIISVVMGITNLQSSAYANAYTDVTPSHPYYKAVCAVSEYGYMNGKSEGIFDPDGYITGIELTKVLVKITGYDIAAQSMGGFPSGYLGVASKYDIIAGAGNLYEPLSRLTFADMLFRAMNVELMDVSVVSSESSQFTKNTNASLLTQRFDTYYGKGRLTDDGFTTLKGVSRVGETQVSINNIPFMKGKVNTTGYIGCNVSFYYRENGGDKILLTIKPEHTETLVVKGDTIEGTINNLSYQNEGESRKRINVSNDFNLIYNGKAYTGYTATQLNSLIKPQSGEVTFIDTDNNGSYDVLSVLDLKTYAVNYVATSPYLFIGDIYERNELTTFFSDKNKAVKIFRNGREITPQMLMKDTVISVAASMDKEIITIYAGTEIINGTVEAIGDDEIVIEGKDYKINKSYYDFAAANPDEAVLPVVGMNARFFLDVEGKISHIVENTEKVSEYAYLYKAYQNTNGINNKIELKLFTGEGKWVETVLSDRGKFNGLRVKDNRSSIMSELSSPQLVTYKMNTAGEVTVINTAIAPGEANLENTLIKRPVLDCAKAKRGWKVNSNVHAFGTAKQQIYDMNLSTQTKVFVIPWNPEETENYRVVSRGSVSGSINTTSVQCEGYDLDEFNVASAVVAYNVARGTSISGSTAYVFERIVYIMDESGDYTPMLYATGEGNSLVFPISENANILDAKKNKLRQTYKDLKSGDIIMIGVDRDTDVIGSVMRVVSIDNIKNGIYTDMFGYYAAKPHITTGILKAKSDEWFLLETGSGVMQPLNITKPAYALSYNVQSGTVTPIKLEEVRENDVCVAICRTVMLNYIIVYEF